jgi:hypothetical protein
MYILFIKITEIDYMLKNYLSCIFRYYLLSYINIRHSDEKQMIEIRYSKSREHWLYQDLFDISRDNYIAFHQFKTTVYFATIILI